MLEYLLRERKRLQTHARTRARAHSRTHVLGLQDRRTRKCLMMVTPRAKCRGQVGAVRGRAKGVGAGVRGFEFATPRDLGTSDCLP